MLQLLLYGLLAVVLAVVLFLIASRVLPAGEQIAPPLRDEPPWELPAERLLGAEDIDGIRLPVAMRGYRFAETDILLDRLAGELRARDQEIARLRGYPTGVGAPPAPPIPSGPADGFDAVAPEPPQPPPPDDAERPVEDTPGPDVRPEPETRPEPDAPDDHARYRP
ncbi:hypothetical protein SAMN05443575_3954 [Jatrophihabitans endophyticus]|uniref:DivIVA domain-containing protein n=1 Tax=Jatrophihabitans endophyticus TaxID=1206085 RepID=A0A1M5TBT3_9ACTN|nr:hypothetical protein [Jatrophihabitans endophyticus]SHH47803.1 hypothetical protein SAMN05443575_3954 [Jatrophihabitans endophyticus]